MPTPQHTSRRAFLNSSLSAGSGFFVGADWSPLLANEEDATSPNERIDIAVIGTGVRGKYLIGNLPPSVHVKAICDCARSRMADTLAPVGVFKPLLARFLETDARRCATYQDYRRLLDREKLDAVIIATPDHHHVPAAMRALSVGLDVYLEKPLTVTIREGRLLADMVKQTGRVLQVGSQQRTMEINRYGCEFILNGGLGRIFRVELPNYPGPILEPDFPEEPVPDELDWNLFCGPAPLRPYHRHLWRKEDYKVGDLLWRGWDLFRDYSGHLMTNWGGHTVDMVQLALGRDATGPTTIHIEQPQSVDSIWQTWRNKTPAPMQFSDRRFWPVVMRYADGVELSFAHGPDFIIFHGKNGRMTMRRNHFEVDPPELLSDAPDPDVADKWKGGGHVARPHLVNWLECIRSRGVPNAPVEAGHRTATICHLANIARELNRSIRWDSVAERFHDDTEADALLDRPRRTGFELSATG